MYLVGDFFLSIYKVIQDNRILLGRWSSLTWIIDFIEILGSYFLESFLLVSFH